MRRFDEKELIRETRKRLYRLPQLLFRIKYSKAGACGAKSSGFDMSKLRRNSKSFVSLIKRNAPVAYGRAFSANRAVRAEDLRRYQ